VRAPWSSNYTININTQMNYWPAETANLAELHEPLLAFIGELSSRGADGVVDVRHAAAGRRTTTPTLAAVGHGRRLGQRRPGVGDVGDGRAVAGAAPLRALPVRR
jgi:alpha-L-fucosidase 2